MEHVQTRLPKSLRQHDLDQVRSGQLPGIISALFSRTPHVGFKGMKTYLDKLEFIP